MHCFEHIQCNALAPQSLTSLHCSRTSVHRTAVPARTGLRRGNLSNEAPVIFMAGRRARMSKASWPKGVRALSFVRVSNYRLEAVASWMAAATSPFNRERADD